MKRHDLMKRAIAASLLAGGCLGLFAANKPGYVVKPSIIVPEWSGATPGVWTMDYASALANAKADGKWTLMLYSGMWWCPHCQPLEEHVLTKPAFSNYVAECGYYTTVLDNIYRDGYSNWCWLYETNYVENVAHLTMEEALQEIDRRYAVQESYALPGATEYNISNWNGTATITYHKVGYPTIIVIRPDGRPAGRFGFSKSQPAETAIAYVTNLIEQVKRHDDWDEIDDFWQTTQTVLPVPENLCEIAVHGEHTLGTRDSADWFKIEIGDGDPTSWTFLFDPAEGLPTANVSVSVYGDPTAEPLSVGDVDFVATTAFSVDFPSAGTYYLKIGATKLPELVGYKLSYLCGTGRKIELGSPSTLVATGEEYAMPTLRDMDGDGLLDLLVGFKEPLASERGILTGYVGRVRIYRNVGTAESPRFGGYSNLLVNGAVLEDGLEKNTGCQGLKVEFGDFDGDGNDDLFVGHHWGELDVYWGTAEAGTYSGTTRILERAGDMTGYRTVPCAHDFDGDGRIELYVGRIDGTYSVFKCDQERNVTDAGSLDDGAGNVLTAQALRSAPAFADMDGDGLLDLVSGDTNGNILFFPATGGGKWSAKSETLVAGRSGSRSRVAVADLDGDGFVDVAVGYADGTVALMRGAPRTEMSCEPAAEGYMPGASIEPIDIVLDPPMAAPSIIASGLPSGLALKSNKTTGAYWIEGTPTKPGTNNAALKLSYTSGGLRRESVLTVPIIVLPLPVLAVDIESIDGGTGRVSGAGAYLVGNKATLSAATDTKMKSVFGGWYADGSPLESCDVDYRTPRISLEIPAVPETRLTARFYRQEEDAAISVYVPNQTLRAGEEIDPVPVQVSSFSFPTVAAKGLPAGVKLDAKTLKLVGTPTKPGDYDVTFSAKNVSKASAEWASRITVLNFTSSEIGPLDERYVFTAGIPTTNDIGVAGCSVSGLPTGLKMDKVSGLIYGTPGVPGTWLVTFTKKVGKVTEKASAWFYVAGAGDALDGSDGIPITATLNLDGEETTVTNGAWQIDLTQGVAWRCAIGSLPTLLPSEATVSVKGLPAGLKFDSKTGVISGAPTKVSQFDARAGAVKPTVVTVVAANKAKWKGLLELEMFVAARPAWAAGTYDGVAEIDGTNGLFTATVAESGTISGKYMIGTKSYSFKASSLAGEDDDGSFFVDAVAAISKSYAVTNRLVLSSSVYESAAATGIDEDTLTGRMATVDDGAGGFLVTNCYQNIWLRKDVSAFRLPVFASGAHKTLAVVRGDLMFRFSGKGKITLAGKLDGKSVSGTCQLLATDFGIPSCYCDTSFYYNGLIPVFLPRQDYFSLVTFMGSSGAVQITGKDEDYDLDLTSDDQSVE